MSFFDSISITKINDMLDDINNREAVGAGMEALGEVQSGFATYKSSALRASILKQNSRAKVLAAKDAITRGDLDREAILNDTSIRIGQQRAALAANGIVVDQDSALDLVVETAQVGAIDAITALYNAELEAEALRRQAAIEQTEAGIERSIGRNAFLSSLGRAGTTLLGAARTISERQQNQETGEE